MVDDAHTSTFPIFFISRMEPLARSHVCYPPNASLSSNNVISPAFSDGMIAFPKLLYEPLYHTSQYIRIIILFPSLFCSLRIPQKNRSEKDHFRVKTGSIWAHGAKWSSFLPCCVHFTDSFCVFFITLFSCPLFPWAEYTACFMVCSDLCCRFAYAYNPRQVSLY